MLPLSSFVFRSLLALVALSLDLRFSRYSARHSAQISTRSHGAELRSCQDDFGTALRRPFASSRKPLL
eukprot:4753005-Pleurochrysis_carterae.AAC.4